MGAFFYARNSPSALDRCGIADKRRDALARLLWERRLRRDALALLWERRQASRLLAGSAFATQATLPQLPAHNRPPTTAGIAHFVPTWKIRKIADKNQTNTAASTH